MINEIIVSPPFGNYITSRRVTSIVGSYTLKARHGRCLKVGQFILDNLRYPVEGGYRNRIGLKNKGIGSVHGLFEDVVYSLVGLEPYDWEAMFYYMMNTPHWGKFSKPHVELNISCPNVHETTISRKTLERYTNEFIVIVKIPPEMEQAKSISDLCGEAGISYLHCSNTLPSELGGLSGYPQKRVNLPIVEEMAKKWTVIGGGGIYEWQDILDYSSAGASSFSTSTIWLNPIKAWKLVTRFHKEKDMVYGTVT